MFICIYCTHKTCITVPVLRIRLNLQLCKVFIGDVSHNLFTKGFLNTKKPLLFFFTKYQLKNHLYVYTLTRSKYCAHENLIVDRVLITHKSRLWSLVLPGYLYNYFLRKIYFPNSIFSFILLQYRYTQYRYNIDTHLTLASSANAFIQVNEY